MFIRFQFESLVNPTVKSFSQQRKIVLEEKFLHDEKPLQKLNALMLSVAFLRHPYRNPIGGYISDLENIEIKDVLDFVKKNYIPNKILMVIIGDVDPHLVINLIAHYFKSFNRKDSAKTIIPDEPLQNGERRIEVENLDYPAILIAYRRPNAHNPDDPVFDILASLFAGYRSSLLYKQIVIDEKIASSIVCNPKFPGAKYSTLFMFWAFPFLNNSIPKIESIIYQNIEELKRMLLTENELNKAKNHVLANFEKKLQSNLGIAQQLAYFEMIKGDWKKLFQYENEVRNVSIKDIKRVINKFFNKRNRVVVFTVDPEKDK